MAKINKKVSSAMGVEDSSERKKSEYTRRLEDITEMMSVAEKFVMHTNEFESAFIDRTDKLENNFSELKKEMILLIAMKKSVGKI